MCGNISFVFLGGVFWVRLILSLISYSPNILDVILFGVCGLPSGGP